jgi:hypothetical protein
MGEWESGAVNLGFHLLRLGSLRPTEDYYSYCLFPDDPDRLDYPPAAARTPSGWPETRPELCFLCCPRKQPAA